MSIDDKKLIISKIDKKDMEIKNVFKIKFKFLFLLVDITK